MSFDRHSTNTVATTFKSQSTNTLQIRLLLLLKISRPTKFKYGCYYFLKVSRPTQYKYSCYYF